MARILIAGGSLGGLMVANLLLRDGHDVQVLEKAVGTLDGRGAGIVTHSALVAGLERCGLPQDTELGVAVKKRITLGGIGPQHNAVLGEHVMPQVLTSWSRLYQLLRALLPDSVYHSGTTLHRVDQRGADVLVTTRSAAGESNWTADLLVAADGIRSTVRTLFWPDTQPVYAGYVAWRGVCDEALLSPATLDGVFESFGFCLPPGEQLIGYPVAGPGNRTDKGSRAYNFVWYRPASAGATLQSLLTDDAGVHHAQGIPPHKVATHQVASMRVDARRLLAEPFAEIIEKTALPFLQPIYDVSSDAVALGRVALVGDAAFVARPHVGMGVTKAMQDAVSLVQAIGEHGATPRALQKYEAARLTAGQHLVARARQLGAYMQASGTAGNALATRTADTVMRETAIDLDTISA